MRLRNRSHQERKKNAVSGRTGGVKKELNKKPPKFSAS
jgi:hypothetical protein